MSYSIYYESQSKVCGDLGPPATSRARPWPSGARTILRPNSTSPSPAASGPLPIGPAERSLDYSFGGFRGTEVATVDVDEPGAYSMVVETRRDGEFAIALGKDVVSTILPWILGAMALAAVGLILGLIILIVTGVKRSRRKREAAMAAATAVPVGARGLHAGGRSARPAAGLPVPPVVPRARRRAPPPPVGEPPGPAPAPPPPDREPVPVGPGAPAATTPRSPRRPARMRGGRRPRSRPRRLRARHPSHRLHRPRTARRSRVRRMTTPRTPTTAAGTTRPRPTRPPARTSPRHRHRRHRKPLPGRVAAGSAASVALGAVGLGPRCLRPRRHRPPELRLRSSYGLFDGLCHRPAKVLRFRVGRMTV